MNDEIEKELKTYKRPKKKLKIKRMRTDTQICKAKGATLKYLIVNASLNG
jgi:hypothetical protein